MKWDYELYLFQGKTNYLVGSLSKLRVCTKTIPGLLPTTGYKQTVHTAQSSMSSFIPTIMLFFFFDWHQLQDFVCLILRGKNKTKQEFKRFRRNKWTYKKVLPSSIKIMFWALKLTQKGGPPGGERGILTLNPCALTLSQWFSLDLKNSYLSLSPQASQGMALLPL